MKILLTCFKPFGGERVNPAQLAVHRVADCVEGAQIVKLDVPVVFGVSACVVHMAMRSERPDAVLCVGQAGGRSGITVERVAINVDDARIADNAGNLPIDAPIASDGPAAYFSTLPIKAMAAAIREAGIPAGISNTAGTYVCNHLMYGVLHAIAKEFPGMRGGFVHVPFAHEQALERREPSLSVEDMVKGLEAAIGAIVRFKTDIAASEGREC